MSLASWLAINKKKKERCFNTVVVFYFWGKNICEYLICDLEHSFIYIRLMYLLKIGIV